MRWRIIGIGKFSAQMNMAVDHAIYESVENGGSPTIRFYQWNNGGISIGKGQSPGIVNVRLCEKEGVGYVRRPTGGNLVYHGKEDFTYSVIAPNRLFSATPNSKEDRLVNRSAYSEICRWIIKAMEKSGLKASLHGDNDVVINRFKVAGSAQKRGKEIFLQHGSIFFSSAPELWSKYLNEKPDKIKEIRPIDYFSDISQASFYSHLLESFTQNNVIKGNYEMMQLSAEERKRANEIAKELYSKKSFLGTGKEKLKGICAIDMG